MANNGSPPPRFSTDEGRTYFLVELPVHPQMPGTGQAPLPIELGAERMFSRALDYLQTRPEIDAGRIVVQGVSWSGYWAALLAYQEKDRIRLTPANGTIAPIYARDVQIQGKVIGVIRRLA